MKKTFITKEWIIRSFSSELSDSDRKQLVEWLESDPVNLTEYVNLKKSWDCQADLYYNNNQAFEESWQRFLRTIHQEVKPEKSRRMYLLRIAASVALVAGITATMVWLLPEKRLNQNRISAVEPEKSYIITPKGEKIILSDNQTEIRYDALTAGRTDLKSTDKQADEDSPMLELVVPRSRRIRLLLADGSRIWLNSESRIRYPERFTGKIRSVTLTGEAFFEVAKSVDKPFVVTARNISIEVMGTSFNVTAYQDENQIATTLVEGSVRLSESGTTGSQLLKPNQRAVYSSESKSFRVEETDTELYTSWINNYLKFSSESLDQVISKLVRSYGIPMTIDDPALKTYKFSGKLDLQETVNQVLDVIQLAAPLTYREENGTILILNKNE